MPVSTNSKEWKNGRTKENIRKSVTQLLNNNSDKAFTVSEIHDHVFNLKHSIEDGAESCSESNVHPEDRQVTLSVVLRVLDELVSERIADTRIVQQNQNPVALYSRRDNKVYV